MGECGTERLEPKISDNGTVVRGERRASLVRGLALPERPRRFFASFLVVQQERRSTGRIDHPDSYDPPVETTPFIGPSQHGLEVGKASSTGVSWGSASVARVSVS